MSRQLRLAVPLALAALALVPRADGTSRRLVWEMLRHDTPLVMWTDTIHSVQVKVHNASTQEWSEATGDHISYHWRRTDGTMEVRDGMRTSFERVVPPGGVAQVQARVKTPLRSGRWVLEWDMVREQVAWFGAPPGGPAVQVRVWVVRRSIVLGGGIVLLSLGGLVVARWRPQWLVPGGWPIGDAAPVAWAWLTLASLGLGFAELGQRQLWLGGGALLASSAALAVLPVALLPPRWRPVGAGVLTVLATVTLLADLAYLRFFGSIVPLVAVATVHQVGQIEGSVFALLRPLDWWLLPAGVCGLAVALTWPRPRPASGRRRLVVAGATLLTTLGGGWHAGRTVIAGLGDPKMADQLFSQEMLIGRWGVLNVHLFDLGRTVREKLQAARPERATIEEAMAFFHNRPPAHPPSGLARGANLLQVQVESFQGWVVGAVVNGQEVTPFINRLRKQSLYFSNVFDQSGQGRSSDGEFITLNSLHALDRGAVSFRRADNRFWALPAVLRAHGYSTLSAHPFERGFWNRAILHPRYGFSQMLFKRELGSGEVIGWGLADEPFFRKTVQKLPALERPFYALFITLGLHHPFDQFPERHKVLDVGDAAGTPLGNYLHAMRYFDSSLQFLVEELQRLGLWENTVLALYGDHESGVELDGRLLAILGAKAWEPSIEVREQKIPFLVRVPGSRVHGERPVVGGHVDIAPTLLDVLGIERPASFVGRSLLADETSWAVLNSGSTIQADRLVVVSGPGIPHEGACFHFPSGAPRPLEECEAARRAGQTQLDLARRVVLFDLVPRLVGESTTGGLR